VETNKDQPDKQAEALTLLTCIGRCLVRIPAGIESMTEVFHLNI
jgi:hypothetical protein